MTSKKILKHLLFVGFITVLGVILFQIGACYPDHGSDSTTFCSTNRFVYFLWYYHLGDYVLTYIAPLAAILSQVYIFRTIQKKGRVLKAYMHSFLAPLTYAILFISLAVYRDVQNSPHDLSVNLILLWSARVFLFGYFTIVAMRIIQHFHHKK